MPARPDPALSRLRRLTNGLPTARIAAQTGARRGEVGINRRRAQKIGRGVSWLLFLTLFVLCARVYIGQRLDLSGQTERVLRTQIAPQLAKALGAKVEFGAVETDWLGRVTVRDVVVGRDKRLPTGALLQAPSVTLGLDLPGIALGRAAFPGAIQSVEIQSPQLYLQRDARGLNWAKLLAKSGSQNAPSWSGQVRVRGGRIYYLDTTLQNAQKEPLVVDARGVDATLDALQNAPYRFTTRLQSPLFGARRVLFQPIIAAGSLDAGLQNGLVTLENRAAPFEVLAGYAFPKREIVARAGAGGTLGGRVVLVMTKGQLAAQGALDLGNLAFTARALRAPGSASMVQIGSLSGPFEFAGNAFSTSGARFSALGTDFKVAGAASTGGEMPFDLNVETPAIPLAVLRPFLPRGFSFSSGLSPLRARLSGNAGGKTRRIEARGTLQTPGAVAVSIPQRARAAFDALKTDFAATLALRPDNSLAAWQIAARGTSPTSKISVASDEIATVNAIFSARAASNGGLEIGVDADAFNVVSARYGKTGGRNLRLAASAPDARRPNWRGQIQFAGASTDGLNKSASPELARVIRGSGALDLNARFSDLDAKFDPQKARVAATFRLASLQLDKSAFAAAGAKLQNADFALSALRGRIALQDGVLDLTRAAATSSLGGLRLDARVPLRSPNAAKIALSLPQARVDLARLAPFLRAQNLNLSGEWRGRLTLLSRAPSGIGTPRAGTPRFGLDFDLRAPFSRLRGQGNGAGAIVLNAPQLQGRAELGASGALSGLGGNGVLRAQSASFQGGNLGQLAVLPAELGGARAENMRLDFDLQPRGDNANPMAGSARFAARALSVPLPPSIPKNRGAVARLQNVSANLETQGGDLRVPRFAASFAGGTLNGTAQIGARGPSARLLARGVDVARLQRLLAPETRGAAQFSGLASALVEVRPGAATRAQIRLTRGAARVVAGRTSGAKTQRFPLEQAHATLLFTSANEVKIRDALVWSEGARGAGEADLKNGFWRGNAQVSGVNLAKLAALPLAEALPRGANLAGLGGGKFGFAFDVARARLASFSGDADLKLAEVFGAGISALGAKVSLQNLSNSGPRLAISDLKGEVEGATVIGEASADFARNSWSANLDWSGAQSARLARLQALSAPASGVPAGGAPRAEVLARALPISGVLGGQIELSGPLRGARGELAPRARDGSILVDSGELVWRGRAFGALKADLRLENGIARAQTLQLLSTPGGIGATGKNSAPGTPIGTPIVQISGALPLDLDAPGLDAEIRIAAAPLSFFTGAAAQSREVLRGAGLAIPFFERAVAYVDALPPTTSGQVALDANLSGTWSAPKVRVSSLTLREGRTRLPSGGFSPPATLDAAFTFDRGAVTIEKAEFKIKKSVSAPFSASAVPVTAPDAAEEDDTLLRIEPGGTATPDGPISLAADVFNANLSQLSPWVPALRTVEGGALLRGEISEFSFRVGGTTLDPSITGSIQGENLQIENYTLDRLRVSRFEIGNGSARIAPGNLTVVKGAFQSSAPYGTVPWSWNVPGPVLDGPLDVHFPLQTRDFGALVGAFVPALSVAEAEEFVGSVDVGGTLRSPALSGAITIRGGQFRLDSTRAPLAAGLRNVSGTLRFLGGTQILIDGDDPLRGQLVSANEVEGRVARKVENRGETGAAQPNSEAPRTGNRGAVRIVKAARNPLAPKLAGDFTLRGGIERPAQIEALLDAPSESSSESASQNSDERRTGAARLRALLDPAAALSRLKYDLSLEFNNGAFASDGFGGVRDVSAGLIWKTGANDAQNVRWMVAARGQKTRRLKSGGDLTSFGALALRRDFGRGIDAIARSGARDFGGEADFSALGVFKRLDLRRAPDRRAQVDFDRFAASVAGAGNGVLDGRLVLDNGLSQQKTPPEAARLQTAALKSEKRGALLFGARFERDFTLSNAVGDAAGSGENATPIALNGADSETIAEDAIIDEGSGAPLRLGGVLTLSNAEIYGAPAGGEGAALLLSRLPGAPRFDVRLKMGRDVQVVTAAFRSGLEGEMVAKGTPNDPQIAGVLTTRGGQVRFPGARARVDEGRVTLALNRDPATDILRTRMEIDATARGQAGRYAITLRLRGPLDLSGVQSAQSLQIDVTSNPPLSQSEALQQLLGTVPDLDYDEKTGTYKVGSVNRAYTNAVLGVISAPLFSGVEQSLAQTLGLTSVGFEYRFNEALAVQVTKALGDRVFVSYRRSLGSGPTSSLTSTTSAGRTPFELRIEYRLKGNYLLGLQTDERQIPSVTLQKTLRF